MSIWSSALSMHAYIEDRDVHRFQLVEHVLSLSFSSRWEERSQLTNSAVFFVKDFSLYFECI